MNAKKTIILLICIMTTMFLVSCAPDSKPLKFGTGNIKGKYYEYGKTFKEVAKKNNISVEIKGTAGAEANVRLVDQNFLQLGMAQSDFLLKDINKKKYKNVRAIANIYNEYLQVIIRNDSNIEKIEELKGKNISVGEKDSNTIINSKQVLTTAGINYSSINALNLSFSDSLDAIKSGKIDAMFFTSSTPIEAINDLIRDNVVKLISLDERLINTLCRYCSEFSKGEIKEHTYENQKEKISTIKVKAVLITNKKTSNELVKKITEMIFKNEKSFSDFKGAKKGKSKTAYALDDISSLIHDGAKVYYEENLK